MRFTQAWGMWAGGLIMGVVLMHDAPENWLRVILLGAFLLTFSIGWEWGRWWQAKKAGHTTERDAK